MLTPHELRRLAARAGVDPRTARDIIFGSEERKKKAHSTTTARVIEAMHELGYRPEAPNSHEK